MGRIDWGGCEEDGLWGVKNGAVCDHTLPLSNPEGQIVRVGRTNDLLRREGEYYRDPNYFDLKYKPEFYMDDYGTQRGLEQMLYDRYQPPMNRNRPIRLGNSNSPNYMNAALQFLLDLFGAR